MAHVDWFGKQKLQAIKMVLRMSEHRRSCSLPIDYTQKLMSNELVRPKLGEICLMLQYIQTTRSKS